MIWVVKRISLSVWTINASTLNHAAMNALGKALQGALWRMHWLKAHVCSVF